MQNSCNTLHNNVKLHITVTLGTDIPICTVNDPCVSVAKSDLLFPDRWWKNLTGYNYSLINDNMTFSNIYKKIIKWIIDLIIYPGTVLLYWKSLTFTFFAACTHFSFLFVKKKIWFFPLNLYVYHRSTLGYISSFQFASSNELFFSTSSFFFYQSTCVTT